MRSDLEPISYFVEGNTVRKMEAAPSTSSYIEERRRMREAQEQEEELKRQKRIARQNQEIGRAHV